MFEKQKNIHGKYEKNGIDKNINNIIKIIYSNKRKKQ